MTKRYSQVNREKAFEALNSNPDITSLKQLAEHIGVSLSLVTRITQTDFLCYKALRDNKRAKTDAEAVEKYKKAKAIQEQGEKLKEAIRRANTCYPFYKRGKELCNS